MSAKQTTSDPPISRLPSDVLRDLFRLVVGVPSRTPTDDVEDIDRNRRALAATSTRWRFIALSHSLLWSLIFFNPPNLSPGVQDRLRWAAECLSRTGTHVDLDIIVNLGDDGDHLQYQALESMRAFRDLLSTNDIQRLRYIGITSPAAGYPAFFPLVCSTPRLKTLNLLSYAIRDFTPLQVYEEELLPEAAPLLSTLGLYGLCWNPSI